MASQIVLLSTRALLENVRRPQGGTLRVAGWLGRAARFGSGWAIPVRAWIVFVGTDGETILIRHPGSLYRRRVLNEVFELCADQGVQEAHRLHPQRCRCCLGDDFIPELTAYTLQKVALEAGRIPNDTARRAGIESRYWAGSSS